MKEKIPDSNDANVQKTMKRSNERKQIYLKNNEVKRTMKQ